MLRSYNKIVKRKNEQLKLPIFNGFKAISDEILHFFYEN